MRTTLGLSFLVALHLAAACDGGPSGLDGALGPDGSDALDAAAAPDAAQPADAGPAPTCDTPGTIEEVPCGRCGTVERFCTREGVWAYGECSGESGQCEPGTEREAECGRCGTARERCTDTCTWSAGACQDEGECAPGELVRSGEGCPSGERDLRCSDACVFEPISECTFDSCDTPGATETVPCGNCGTRTRFCTSDLEWQYSPCGDEGVCAPGSTRSTACGNCGTREERCDTTCAWAAFDACTGEGECSPGTMSTTSMGCPSGQERPTTCDAICTFVPSGACTAPVDALGDACTPGSCQAGLTCSSETGVDICREPCTSNADCTAPRFCFTGSMTCSDDCALWTDAGCPSGSKCDFMGYPTFFGDPARVCSGVGTLPAGSRCTVNAECRRGHICLVDAAGDGACTQFCDGAHPCPAGQTCDVGFGSVGYCQST